MDVYTVDGSSFNKVKAKNNNGIIHFVNDSFQHFEEFQSSIAAMKIIQNNWKNTMQQRQDISNNFNPTMHYGSIVEPMNYSGNVNNTNENIHQIFL